MGDVGFCVKKPMSCRSFQEQEPAQKPTFRMGKWCEHKARKFETGILGVVQIFPTSRLLFLGFEVAEGAGARNEEI